MCCREVCASACWPGFLQEDGGRGSTILTCHRVLCGVCVLGWVLKGASAFAGGAEGGAAEE